MWMRIIIVAIISMTAYLLGRRFQGIGPLLIKIVFGLTLICVLYGGIKVFWSILNFEFGTDIGILIVLLSYAIPIVFLYSALSLGYWLIKERRAE